MLKSSEVARIIRLADDGLSIRSISLAVGIARETVRMVVKRRRRRRQRKLGFDDEPAPPPAAEARANPEQSQEVEAGKLEPVNELAENGLYDVKRPVFSQPPARCPTCGDYCYMPCLACRLRRLTLREKKKQSPQGRRKAK